MVKPINKQTMMKLNFFCPRWGSEHLDWDTFLQNVTDAGYDGVEYGIPNDISLNELEQVWEKIDKYKLSIIPQHYGTYDADFNKHYDTYAGWLEKIGSFKSLKINSQTGKDFFTFDQNKALIELAGDYGVKYNVEICHETHRNKFSFAAHVTKEYLLKIPDLKLTLDASHWVTVAESYLTDQHEAMELAISRTAHIHARVGYPEGPQVPDPRSPEWQEAVQVHLGWWDKVIERKRNEERDSIFTITPEFGPFPYMVQLPFTAQPIANQWEINKHMMDILKI
jgi:sugar phosphate isomerase/epimerase